MLLAKCSQCEASWRIPYTEEGTQIICPFCSSAFGFKNFSQAAVAVEKPDFSDAITGEDTVTADLGGGNRIAVLSLPQNLKISLEILNGVNAGVVFEIKKSRSILGRGAGDFEINDSQVSRKHAVLEVYGDRYILLKDLASTNGTYVNGVPVSQIKIENGDVVRFGVTELKLKIEKRP